MILDEINKYDSSVRQIIFVVNTQNDNLRNKVQELEKQGLKCLNVGKEFAGVLKNIENKKHLSIESQEHLTFLLDKNINQYAFKSDKVLVLYNLGILFEPVLSLNVENILKDFAKRCKLIIIWENNIENDILFWGNNKDKFNLDFSDIILKQL